MIDIPDQIYEIDSNDLELIRASAKTYFQNLCNPDKSHCDSVDESSIVDAVMTALYGKKWEENSSSIFCARLEGKMNNA